MWGWNQAYLQETNTGMGCTAYVSYFSKPFLLLEFYVGALVFVVFSPLPANHCPLLWVKKCLYTIRNQEAADNLLGFLICNLVCVFLF